MEIPAINFNNKPPNFIILSDIDGVLVHDGIALENAINGVANLLNKGKKLLENYSPNEIFFCLTNGGGQSEANRAKKMNLIFQQENFFHSERMFLSHTVIGRKFIQDYKEKRILVIARDSMGNLLEEYGFKNYIFIWDFLKMHPYLCPYSSKLSNNFEVRFGVENNSFISLEELPNQEPIEAIMVLENPLDWNDAAQVICDLLQSDGRVGCNRYNPLLNYYEKENNSSNDIDPNKIDQQIPLIFCNPDLTYSGEYKVPRFTQGAFKFVVKSLFKELTGKEINNIHQFGKPLKSTYDFVKECMQSHLRCSTLPERIYMIGDNPKSDIQGGNLAGMITILVRTGCFQGEANDIDFPSKYVCNNFEEAIDLILQNENNLIN